MPLNTSLNLSPAVLRLAVSLVAVFIVAACTDNRGTPLSQVQIVDIPVANAGPQANQNISNPTLEIPVTYPVADGDELTLVWSEEFDGPEIDPEKWFFATGDGSEKGLPRGWGNKELQYYLPDNAMIVNGVLEITARRETVGDFDFTSARINTEDRFAFKYGRVEASMKMPAGQGLWSAFWMLSQDSDYVCDANGRPCDWAAVGEIDIVEAINLDGANGDEIIGTIHYGDEFPNNQFTSLYYSPSVDITEGFHTYAIEWDEFEIRWYFDGQLYAVQNSWFSTALNGGPGAPFNQNFHILLNLAVGGNLPGSPNGATPFPATMEVDWVRVYSGEESVAEPAGPGIIPEATIYAADGSPADLTPSYSPFGSGSSFATVADSSYANAFQITVGAGYGGGALAQLGLSDFGAGFATGYGEFLFKAKGLTADNTILVKFEATGGGTVTIDLTAPPTNVAVTDLGDGWSQVVIQMAAFGDISDSSQIVFQTVDGAYSQGATFLLTDIGFNNAGGGGGGGGAGGGGSGGDLVPDGGFEVAGTSGLQPPWLTDPLGGTVSVSNANNNGGTYAARLQADATSGSPSFPILKVERLGAGSYTGGEPVTISFDAIDVDTTGAGKTFVAEFFTERSDPPGGATNEVILGGYGLSGAWQNFTFNTTLGADAAGGVSLLFKADCGANTACTMDVFIDNVSITVN